MIVHMTDATNVRRFQLFVGVCLVTLLAGTVVLADEAPDPFAGLAPANDQTLYESHGGADDELSLAELGASVIGNSITGNVTTGSATIGGDAFSDLNGVSSVLVNSGNNVSIQSSTVVNIVIYE